MRPKGKHDKFHQSAGEALLPQGAPVVRRVQVAGATSELALHIETWRALDEICSREGMSREELLTILNERSGRAALRRAVEVFAATYFRSAAAMA